MRDFYVDLLSLVPSLSPPQHVPLSPLCCLTRFKYLLAVLQDALLGADAALGAGGVRLPFATLHIDVHVELPAEHGHLGLS